MAKFSDVNFIMNLGSVAAEAGQFFYRFKQVLKAAGWTVPASSDSLTYSSTGDVITHAGTGAGGVYNIGAWFILREPGGRREICLQRTATSMYYRVKYSALARFIGGTPGVTRVPSATDEQTIAGSGTDASPTGGSFFNIANVRGHIIANSTPISGVYPFAAFTTSTPGSSSSPGEFHLEPMAPGSYDPLDADPCVMKCGLGGSGIDAALNNALGWFAYGTPNQVWATNIVGVNATFNGTLAQDLVNSRDVNGRPLYTATISGQTRIKGYGSTIALKGPSRNYPTTANRATDAYVYIGSVVVPYADNTEPGV